MEQHKNNADNLQRLTEDPDFAKFECAFDTAECSSRPMYLGCNSTCSVEHGALCGDAVCSNCFGKYDTDVSKAACDDGNSADNEGCNSTCSFKHGWVCNNT